MKRSVYTFTADWLEVFELMNWILQPEDGQRFSIWIPKDKYAAGLVILYGFDMPTAVKSRYGLTSVTDTQFEARYEPLSVSYFILGYNEFKKTISSYERPKARLIV